MLSKHRTDWATSLAPLTRFLIPSVRLQLKLVDAPVWTFYYHHLGLLSVQMSRLLTAAVVLVSEKSHPIPTPTTCIWGTSLNLTLQLTFCPWLQSHGHVLIQNSLSLKSSHSDFLNIQCLATCWQAGILRGSVLCLLFSKSKGPLRDVFSWLKEAVMCYPSGLGTWKGSLGQWSHREGRMHCGKSPAMGTSGSSMIFGQGSRY